MAALASDEGTTPAESHGRATLIKFFLPSALGLPLFLVPVNVDGATKVLLGVIAHWRAAWRQLTRALPRQ